MKTIKDRFAPAESKRAMMFQLGLIVGCALLLVAFKWTKYEIADRHFGPIDAYTDYLLAEEIPVIKPDKPKQEKKKVLNPSHIEIIPDEPEPDTDEPVIDTSEIEPDLHHIDAGEGDVPDESHIPLTPLEGWQVDRMPYYTDCADFLDPEAEHNCTAAKIIALVQRNAKYPELAKNISLEGTVWLSFVVNETGEIVDIEVARSVHPILDKEAIRALKTLPRLNPAKQDARPVPVRYNTRVKFELKKS